MRTRSFDIGGRWKSTLVFLTLIATSAVFPPETLARRCRPELIPNGDVVGCGACHQNPNGGGVRTPFGEDVRPLVSIGGCDEFWDAALAALDSDGDGRSNGNELEDPLGEWTPGDSAPGDSALVTNPGVPDELPTGEISVEPESLEFGFVSIGEEATLALTIGNTGAVDLDVADAAFAEESSSAFALSSPFSPTSIPPGASVELDIRFAPSEAAELSGAVILSSDDPATPELAVEVTGTGEAAPVSRIEVFPTEIRFDSVPVGATSSLVVEVRSVGSSTLEVASIEVFGGDGNFAVAPLELPLALPPTDVVELDVQYEPGAPGEHSASLVIGSNAPDSPELTVELSGTGTDPVLPRIETIPSRIDFGQVTLGSEDRREVQIRNAGGAALEIERVRFDEDTFAAFSLDTELDGVVLAPGATAVFAAVFVPTDPGVASGAVMIESNDELQNPVVIPLAGEGTELELPNIGVEPGALTFGEVLVGESVVDTLTLTNTGAAGLLFDVVELDDIGSSFSLTDAPPAMIPAGESRVVEVEFSPDAGGSRTGTLTFQSNDPDTPSLDVPLSGEGLVSPRFVRGNANADASIDISDALFILDYLFSGTRDPECLKATDTNDSGATDIADPIYLLLYLFSTGSAPPEPFETCGSDPTPDATGCDRFPPCAA